MSRRRFTPPEPHDRPTALAAADAHASCLRRAQALLHEALGLLPSPTPPLQPDVTTRPPTLSLLPLDLHLQAARVATHLQEYPEALGLYQRALALLGGHEEGGGHPATHPYQLLVASELDGLAEVILRGGSPGRAPRQRQGGTLVGVGGQASGGGVYPALSSPGLLLGQTGGESGAASDPTTTTTTSTLLDLSTQPADPIIASTPTSTTSSSTPPPTPPSPTLTEAGDPGTSGGGTVPVTAASPHLPVHTPNSPPSTLHLPETVPDRGVTEEEAKQQGGVAVPPNPNPIPTPPLHFTLASRALSDALPVYRRRLHTNDPRVLSLLRRLLLAECEAGEYTSARGHAEELLGRLLEGGMPPGHPELAPLYLTLSELCGILEEIEDGYDFAEKGLACLSALQVRVP